MQLEIKMIEQIKDSETKKAIARKILEALHDWFEVDESREKYIADCVNWIFWRLKKMMTMSVFFV